MSDHDFGECRLFPDGDAFYENHMRAHEALSEAEHHVLRIGMAQLMANHISDLKSLAALIDASSCIVDRAVQHVSADDYL